MTELSLVSSQPLVDDETQDSSDAITRFSQVLKACADPLRVQILNALKSDTFGVLELTQIFETKQSGMSHHLKVLSQSGLVEAQREGNAIFYRRPINRSPDFDNQAIEELLDLVDRFELSTETLEKIATIQNQRADQSQIFFSKNADRFQAQQELIADHSLYADASFELLAQSFPKENQTNKCVMEIGPGEGLFLSLLSKKFSSIVALDNSEDMLKKAQQAARKNNLSNIKFYLGDTSFYSQSVANQTLPKVDAVVMNMVLHHIPTPAKVFQDISRFLNSNGILVICELSHHHQEWTRDNCGDLWLGFEEEELSKWATSAGFTEQKAAFIGLRNGFQIQLRKFIYLENTN